MSSENAGTGQVLQLFVTNHPRSFGTFSYVYPVVSRRAGGVSIGINLNPDKICNFDCVYCQVERVKPLVPQEIDLDRLRAELAEMLAWITREGIFEHPAFADLPRERRRVHDIAFSGDGEPTACPKFKEAVQIAAEARRNLGFEPLKIVLITNATLLDRPQVEEGLAILDANNGEIWAKLDAGTPGYFARVARTKIPFDRILKSITHAACKRPIVIQSLFMRLDGEPPSEAELHAYCERLNEIGQQGGKIKLVQIYTVSRKPAESFVSSLSDAELSAIGEMVRQRTRLPVAVFGSLG